MLGTYVNVIAIIIGSLIGLLFGSKLSKKFTKIIQSVIALAIISIGVMGLIKMTNPLLIVVSLILGAFVGKLLGLDKLLTKLGKFLEARFQNGNISNGFITATLVYCVGAMAIYGAIESGINGDHSTLYLKSVLDGITSIIFASTLGIGVLLSAAPVLIYQGSITLLATFVGNNIPEIAITNMTAVGGILLIGIALNILNVTKLKLTNLVPALFVPIIYYIIF